MSSSARFSGSPAIPALASAPPGRPRSARVSRPTGQAISAFVRPADRIEPRPETANVYRRCYRRYRDLYRRLADRSELICIMSLFRAVAWDIDGTLIDSEPLHERGLVGRERRPWRRSQRS